MGKHIKENITAVFPLAFVLGIWIAFIDSFQVVAGSVRLLGSVKSLTLVLVYGCLATQVVILVLAVAVSIIVTMLDRKGRLDATRHAGRVIGIVVFLLVLGAAAVGLRGKMHGLNPLDPRLLFPMLAYPVFGWVAARLVAVYIARTYNASKSLLVVGNHYAAATGVSVFAFGSFMVQYNSMKDLAHGARVIIPGFENVAYYIVFAILGIITFLVLRIVFKLLSRRGWAFVAGLIALFIIVPLAVFLRPAPPNDPDKHNPAPSDSGKNVLLISIDTLRYDKLGCTGNPVVRTPNIDALASEGVIFDNCIVPLPLTIPSHTTMLTGLNPRTHGVRVQDYFLADSFTTLAERLSDEGFTCGGMVSMSMLSGKSCRLDQGFHYYDDFWVYAGQSKYFPPEVRYFLAGRLINKIITGRTGPAMPFERRGDEVVDSAIGWLNAVKEDDFFGFVHLYDVHWEYSAPEPYTTMYDPGYSEDKFHYDKGLRYLVWDNKLQLTQDDIDYIEARYDGEVTYTDSELGRLFDELKRLGLWDSTMIILTADHGESFEHDYYFAHADRTYQSCVHVPLIIKPFKGDAAGRSDVLCSNADFFPTVCEMLGISTRVALDGESLAGIVNGSVPPDWRPYDAIYTESFAFDREGYQHIGRTYAILKDTWKLIYSPYAFPYTPISQCFNLELDPDEEYNIYDESIPVMKELFLLLKKWVDADKTPEMELSGRIEREALESLQYVR